MSGAGVTAAALAAKTPSSATTASRTADWTFATTRASDPIGVSYSAQSVASGPQMCLPGVIKWCEAGFDQLTRSCQSSSLSLDDV